MIYGILAKSGAGKTTLLKTISGLLHPVHGEVVIDGTTYRNADKNPVYMMHQRYSNFGWLSCTENVLIAQRDKKLRSRDDASNEDFQLTPDTGEDDQGEHKYNRYRSNHNAHYCVPSLPATPFANSKS